MSYSCRNSTGLLNLEFWAYCTFWHKFGSWQNFTMSSPETLTTKVAINKLSFPLVTHTVLSDDLLDSYWLLNSEMFWTDWTYK
jgi:hypothetical protein